MLARLSKFENQVSLIEGTGIQFLDFGFCSDPKRLTEGNFLQGQVNKLDGSSAQLPILLSQDSAGNWYRSKTEKYTGPVNLFSTGAESLKAFNSRWLPIPFFK